MNYRRAGWNNKAVNPRSQRLPVADSSTFPRFICCHMPSLCLSYLILRCTVSLLLCRHPPSAFPLCLFFCLFFIFCILSLHFTLHLPCFCAYSSTFSSLVSSSPFPHAPPLSLSFCSTTGDTYPSLFSFLSPPLLSLASIVLPFFFFLW